MELKDFIAYLDAHLDPESEESILSMAPYLRALGSNERFLADYLAANLEDPNFQSGNFYAGATLILGRGKQYAVRAVGWEPTASLASPRQPHVYTDNDKEALAHTHPFALLTFGYAGPGYVTDMFDCDPYELLERRMGQRVTLGPCRRAQLSKGSEIFFPAFRIAHIQHPPQTYSVSLNLLVVPRNDQGFEQYFVNPESGVLTGSAGAVSDVAISILELASRLPGDNGVRLLTRVADSHALRGVRDHAAKLLHRQRGS